MSLIGRLISFFDRDRFSKAWEEVSQEEKDAIGLVSKDEGEFYMSYKSALKYFYQVDICYWIPPEEMNRPDSKTTMLTYHGSWSNEENTAGGQGKYTILQLTVVISRYLGLCSVLRYSIAEIQNNPQYTVDLVDDTGAGKDVTMIISILFKAGLKDDDPSLGVSVYPVFYFL